MRILTFLVVFLVFLAMTASLFWTAWTFGRRFSAKHGTARPDPPPDKEDVPDRDGHP